MNDRNKLCFHNVDYVVDQMLSGKDIYTAIMCALVSFPYDSVDSMSYRAKEMRECIKTFLTYGEFAENTAYDVDIVNAIKDKIHQTFPFNYEEHDETSYDSELEFFKWMYGYVQLTVKKLSYSNN